MSRLLRTPLGLLLRRLALLYGVLMLCRAAFYAVNASIIGPVGGEEIGPLLRGALLFDTASIGYADGLFILLSLLPLPAAVRDSRWYRNLCFGYYTIVNSLLVVVPNLADAVYFRYTQKRFTADEIFFADNDNSLLLAGKFLAENWLLALFGAALILLLVKGYGRRLREERIVPGYRGVLLRTLLLAVAAGLCIGGIRGGFTRQTRPITLSNATLYTPDSHKAHLLLSNPFCLLRTIGETESIRCPAWFDEPELSQRFSPVHTPPDSAAVDLSGRNVVIFIMESMSAEHSALLRPDLYPEGGSPRGFTPFLDSLMRSGVQIPRFYANGTRSIQAMPSVLGSIPSFRTPFVLMPQSLGPSRQLPALLREMGYSTLFLCGSERGSMGFGAYARSAGVDRLVSREDYEARHGTDDYDGYWGIWDEPFLQFAGEVLGETPEPFCATLFTLSAHHPFVVPETYADSLPEGFTRIHKGVAYDDLAFRRFFERYAGEEWFQRTLFVFTADHVSSEKYAPESRQYPHDHHIIGFFYTPDGTWQGRIDGVVQQLDIMPTVLGLLGNRRPYFAFGRDLLNEPDRPAWSVSYDQRFRAVTAGRTLSFDDRQPVGDPADTLTQRLRALVQHYYQHVERKNYLPE